MARKSGTNLKRYLADSLVMPLLDMVLQKTRVIIMFGKKSSETQFRK